MVDLIFKKWAFHYMIVDLFFVRAVRPNLPSLLATGLFHYKLVYRSFTVRSGPLSMILYGHSIHYQKVKKRIVGIHDHVPTDLLTHYTKFKVIYLCAIP